MSPFLVLESPSLYGCKPRFQRLLRPCARHLARLGIRANQVTVFTCLLSMAAGSFLLLAPGPRMFAVLPAVFLIRMALNAMDGILAREFQRETALGLYLNEVADVVSDLFLYLPFAHLSGFNPFWIWNVVVLSVISEMTGVLAVAAGARRRYDGPMGKSDRALVFGATALWAALGGLPVTVAWFIPRLMALLLVVTIANRIHGGLKEAEEGSHAAA